MLRLLTMPTLVGILAVVLAAGCGGGGGSSSGSLQLVISGATPPPGMSGVPYTAFTFTVASGGVAPFTWSETGALPVGMSFSPSGQLSGTPATAGTYPLTVMVTDSSRPALTATVSVSLVIQDSQIVVATAPAPPAGARGNPYPDYTFSVASGGSPPFTWAVTAGALPDGLMLAANGTLSGTPTKNGTFLFTVMATDSATPAGTGSAPFSITVNNPGPPVIENTAPPTGTVGVVYSPFQFQASNGLPPLVWSPPTGSTPGFVFSTTGVLSGTPTMAGHFPITIKVIDHLGQASPDTPFTVRVSLARPAAAFKLTTGNMRIARYQHSATLLTGGKVLVAGGVATVGGGPDSTAEVYDPVTETFADAMGPMTEARAGHTATLLTDGTGKVLIAGGSAMNAAELFNPGTETFAATGSLITARLTTTATLLKSGKVLVAGGSTPTSAAITAAELYNPATGKFTATTGPLNFPRSGHTATLLNNGKVLVAGGVGVATAELYDPATDAFTTTGSMNAPRLSHTATLLNDPASPDYGKVLVVGTEGTADLYDPSTGTFAAVGNLPAASARAASLHGDGTVVVAGGFVMGTILTRNRLGQCVTESVPVSVTSAELFAPESEGFTATGSLIVPREQHTATELADRTVLIVGGLKHFIGRLPPPADCRGEYAAAAALSSAELFK